MWRLWLSANAYQKYKKTSVQSASKEKLLLMMYEGAIKYMKRAVVAIEKNNLAEKGINIGHAYDIVMELNNTLDHTIGGEVAANLEQLYMFVTDQLIQANINNDKVKLEDAIRIMTTLLDGWSQAVEQVKKRDASR